MFSNSITSRDLSQKIFNTIVLYDNLPVFVTDITEARMVYFHALDGSEIIKAKYDSPKFNYKPFPLGYVNVANNAHYLERMPMRHYKQGLEARAVTVSSPRVSMNTGALLRKPLLALYRNEYPSKAEAIRTLTENSKCQAIAFDREFCFARNSDGDIYVEYRGKKCGWIDYEGNTRLGHKFSFLKETLAEKGI